MVKWTKQQTDAIELRDKNILVSAAAGSGKTAVLVERIKQQIIKDKVGIDQFLIVTFTNAAAAEMREKLMKAITDEIKSDTGNSSFLKRQLDIIGTANISTFHSFALEVIRRYFYLTDVEPDFKIGDEGAVEIIRRDILDELFDDYFDSGSEEFLEFLKMYSSDRNEKAIKENILGFYSTLQSIPHPLEWLENHVQDLQMSKNEFMESEAYNYIYKDIEYSYGQVTEAYNKAMELAELAGAEGIYEKCKKDYDKLEEVRSVMKSGDLDAFGNFCKTFTPERLVPKKADKESDYENYKEQISKHRKYGKSVIEGIVKRYFTQSMDTYIEDMQMVYPQACFLCDLIKDFDSRFSAAKKARKIIDFTDIEHYALQILENDQVAEEYRKKFEFIFVDEYQDSNVMQDTLINQIKRENNLFVVGDVKQCIYKFRLAEPEIFRARYEAYADDDDIYSEKIDLNRNFRSKKSVINTVNDVFSLLMKGYTEEAHLYQGDPYDGDIDYKTELHIIDNQITKEEGIDEELADMKNAELEAHYVAGLIRDALGTEIYDSKKQCVRPVEMKDIVILMRSTKNFADVYQEVFRDLDIPSYVDESSGFFDTVEIQVFLNLLTIIDNMQQDVPLISVMHSSICDFTVDDLVRIRLAHKKDSYYEALCSYRETDDELGKKVRYFFEKIDQYRTLARALPLEEFVWKLMWDTGYYTYCGALPAGRQRQANLKALADRARTYKDTGYGGIYGFLTYMRAIEKRQVPMGQVKLVSKNEDLVRIMTIHKSKGLEFPVVIVAGMGKKLNISSKSGNFSVHKDFGVGMTRVSPEGKWKRDTFLKVLMEQKLQQDERDENIRVLYVALTRAKDRLILVGTGDYYKDGQLKDSAAKSTYIDHLISVRDECCIETVPFERERILTGKSGAANGRKLVLELLDHPAGNKDPELEYKFSFKYGNETALSKKSKYSVTEFSKQSMFDDIRREELKIPQFMQTQSSVSAARAGTVMHKVMEVINFAETLEAVENGKGVTFLEEKIKRMVSEEFIYEEDRQYIEIENIIAFFNTDVGRRAALSEELHKEAEFNFIKESDGVEIMIQGIIDCFFREGDSYVLIDYKNSYIDPERKEEGLKRIRETYCQQVELYREAIRLIKGAEVSGAYLYLFSEGEFIEIQ